MDEATLRYLEVAGAWVSGIGTLLAVWVSLYLARRQTAVRLGVSAGHRYIITQGSRAKPEYLSIKVVNLGQQPVTITSVGWQFGVFRKSYGFQLLNATPLSHMVPIELTTGKEANFLVPLNEETKWLQSQAARLDRTFPSLSAWAMKVQISTSVGKIVSQRLEKGLRKKLVEARATIADDDQITEQARQIS